MTWETYAGSTIPFPIVAATWVETRAPTKLSPAAMRIAFRIDRARVEMHVAIAFAVSWKPLMKSKASAETITSASRTRCCSCILERHAFQDVGGVLGTVGRGLERLVDLLPLEDGDRVLLVLEEVRDRVAADAVRLVLQGGHLDAMLVYLAHLRGEAGEAPVELAGGREDQEPELLGLGGHLGDLVEAQAGGGGMDQVDHVVDRRGEVQDVLPVDRGDESGVELPDDLVGEGVPLVLDLLDLPGLLLHVVEVVEEVLEELGPVEDVLRGLLEEHEEF